MNNDLMSREYMKKAIEQFFVKEKYYHPHSKGRKTIPTEEVIDIIDNAPTVELFCPYLSDEEIKQPCLEGPCKRPQGEWIPIKMRPGTDEEYEEFSQYGDCPREDFRVFECPLPDDDQEVLVTTRWGNVCTDIWHRDVDCCYFEDNCDDDDVIAWMPLPESYKKEGAE